MAAANSLRKVPDATVSAPFAWSELPEISPREFTLATMPARFAALGDLHAAIDDQHFRLETLLEWAARDESDPALRTPPPERADGGAGPGKVRQQVAPGHADRVRTRDTDG